MRLWSTDLHKSREFYHRVLGLGPGTGGCVSLTRPCFSVNDHQQIELLQVTAGDPANFVAEVAFATPDVAQMQRYLTAHSITTTAIEKDADGVQHFALSDPEGNHIAFVQLPAAHFFTPTESQVSTRLIHAGFIVRDRAAEDHFYRDLLGFRLYWHGGFKDSDTDWWEIQVPEGTDWIEYMLNISEYAKHDERGIQNHFSLAVEKIRTGEARLRANGLTSQDHPEIGRDGKWSYDIYDPDGTRVEFMEYRPAQTPCCNPYTGPQPKP